jgi:hypothetical protein
MPTHAQSPFQVPAAPSGPRGDAGHGGSGINRYDPKTWAVQVQVGKNYLSPDELLKPDP